MINSKITSVASLINLSTRPIQKYVLWKRTNAHTNTHTHVNDNFGVAGKTGRSLSLSLSNNFFHSLSSIFLSHCFHQYYFSIVSLFISIFFKYFRFSLSKMSCIAFNPFRFTFILLRFDILFSLFFRFFFLRSATQCCISISIYAFFFLSGFIS